jgi:hypothetical protein
MTLEESARGRTAAATPDGDAGGVDRGTRDVDPSDARLEVAAAIDGVATDPVRFATPAESAHSAFAIDPARLAAAPESSPGGFRDMGFGELRVSEHEIVRNAEFSGLEQPDLAPTAHFGNSGTKLAPQPTIVQSGLGDDKDSAQTGEPHVVIPDGPALSIPHR